jgi:hypothetical protein
MSNAMSTATSNAKPNGMSDPLNTTRRPLFLPTARQTNWLVAIGFLAVGEALYLRFMAIENANMARACQSGLSTWLCSTYRVAIPLFQHEVFGALALAIALVNLMRPSVVLIGLALAAAGFGLVLHNVDLAALAIGVLILSLARRAPAPE